MGFLIDTVYLDLSKPSVEAAAWRETRRAVEEHLFGFQTALVARTREVEAAEA